MDPQRGNLNSQIKSNGSVGFLVSLGRITPQPITNIFWITLLLVIVSPLIVSKSYPDVIQAWGKGFISQYPFAMEIILIFGTGYVLALTKPVKSLLKSFASLPKNVTQAAVLIGVISLVLSWFNWALGFVGGVFLAREIAKLFKQNQIRAKYSVLITAVAASLLTWENGLSGIVPLSLAQEGNFIAKQFSVVPVSETIISIPNIITTLLLLVGVIIAMSVIGKSVQNGPDIEELSLEGPGEEDSGSEVGASAESKTTLAIWLENAQILNIVTALVAFIGIAGLFAAGGTLTIDNYLFMALFLGLLLCKRPMEYAEQFGNSVRFIWGFATVLVLFAGVQGVVNYTGLAELISGWLIGIGSQQTFPLITFIVSAIMNLIMPITGAQWMVQGQFLAQAGSGLSVPLSVTSLAFVYGAGWAKLIEVSLVVQLLGIPELKDFNLAKNLSIMALISLVIFVFSLLVLF